MDVNQTSNTGFNEEVQKLLASLGGSGRNTKKKGVWVEVGDMTDFVSFRRYSNHEIEYKVYDDVGGVTEMGIVNFYNSDGKVNYSIRDTLDGEAYVSSWFAPVVHNKGLEVYTSSIEVDGEEEQRRFGLVLKAYAHLNNAQFLLDEVKYEEVGVGLSGEAETKILVGVESWGKLG